MSYPGGKGKIYQHIISLMPKHFHYVELFLGDSPIMKLKKPAAKNYGVEIDKEVWQRWKDFDFDEKHFFFPICKNVIQFLDDAAEINFFNVQKPMLIYADPPYLLETRSSKNKIYKYEMMQAAEHEILLLRLKTLPCMVMISGYESQLYNEILHDWRKVSFNSTNRAGKPTVEIVWMNFPEPLELHDYRFLGKNFREREKIKRKKERWKNRLLKMPNYERLALMATIDELKIELTS